MVLLREIADVIRNIIVIIVIATFVEIFLPRSAFNRYVKMVVGLMVILSLLQPVRKLLHVPVLPDLELEYGSSATGNGQDLAALFPARVLAEFREKLADSMEKTVKEATGNRYSSKVLLTMDDSDYLNPQITAVRVTLQPLPEAEDEAGVISIDEIEIAVNTAGAEGTEEGSFSEVKKALSEKYSIPPDLITVAVER